MAVRRVLWIVIALMSVIVLTGGGLVTWLLLRGQDNPIRLVVMGSDTTVRLIDSGGDRLLAGDASTNGYGFPAPSPDGRRLAYVASDENGAAIFQIDIAGGGRKELYRSKADVPLDLAWSPDGRYVVFLLGGGSTVHLVPADGSQSAQLIGTGPPSYFAWSPDSTTLLLHLGGHMFQGGRLEAYRSGADRATALVDDPGFFQAPAWSIDGTHFFYVAQPPISGSQPTPDDIESTIVRVTADGKEPTVLAREKLADLRLVRAPNADRIAYSVRTIDGFGALKLVDGAGGAARMLSRPNEHVTAFFWSPTGTQIAYLTHDGEYESTGPRAWHIVDVEGGAIRDFAPFTPSAAFAALQVYFDAYIFSFSPWSPDGGKLAYGASDGVYVLDVAAGRAAKAADGALGMWVGGR